MFFLTHWQTNELLSWVFLICSIYCSASLMTFKVDSSKAGDVCSNKKLFLCCSGFPRWCRGRESTCQCRRCELDPWVGKIPWSRKWPPTPVFLPGNSMDSGAWWVPSMGLQRVGHVRVCTQRERSCKHCLKKELIPSPPHPLFLCVNW